LEDTTAARSTPQGATDDPAAAKVEKEATSSTAAAERKATTSATTAPEPQEADAAKAKTASKAAAVRSDGDSKLSKKKKKKKVGPKPVGKSSQSSRKAPRRRKRMNSVAKAKRELQAAKAKAKAEAEQQRAFEEEQRKEWEEEEAVAAAKAAEEEESKRQQLRQTLLEAGRLFNEGEEVLCRDPLNLAKWHPAVVMSVDRDTFLPTVRFLPQRATSGLGFHGGSGDSKSPESKRASPLSRYRPRSAAVSGMISRDVPLEYVRRGSLAMDRQILRNPFLRAHQHMSDTEG